MAKFNRLPVDPLIEVVTRDAQANPLLQCALGRIRNPVLVYRKTLHISDDALEAWYKFKENQTCRK